MSTPADIVTAVLNTLRAQLGDGWNVREAFDLGGVMSAPDKTVYVMPVENRRADFDSAKPERVLQMAVIVISKLVPGATGTRWRAAMDQVETVYAICKPQAGALQAAIKAAAAGPITREDVAYFVKPQSDTGPAGGVFTLDVFYQ